MFKILLRYKKKDHLENKTNKLIISIFDRYKTLIYPIISICR